MYLDTIKMSALSLPVLIFTVTTAPSVPSLAEKSKKSTKIFVAKSQHKYIQNHTPGGAAFEGKEDDE